MEVSSGELEVQLDEDIHLKVMTGLEIVSNAEI